MFKKILAALAMLYAALSWAAVDVNTASAADLDSVKGIGPAMSARILDERKKAPFKDWADLKARVKGVGDKSAAKLSEAGLTVGGASYPGAKPARAKAAAQKPATVATTAQGKPAMPATPASAAKPAKK